MIGCGALWGCRLLLTASNRYCSDMDNTSLIEIIWTPKSGGLSVEVQYFVPSSSNHKSTDPWINSPPIRLLLLIYVISTIYAVISFDWMYSITKASNTLIPFWLKKQGGTKSTLRRCRLPASKLQRQQQEEHQDQGILKIHSDHNKICMWRKTPHSRIHSHVRQSWSIYSFASRSFILYSSFTAPRIRDVF